MRRAGALLAARRENEEDQPQHEGNMDATMHHFGEQAKSGRVIVKAGQREQKPRHQPSGPRQQGPELYVRIVLGLKLVQVCRQLRKGVRRR
jgi:hypothetical protein